MILTHEVSVSLHEGSICPMCGDTKLVPVESDAGRPNLLCPGCEFVERKPFVRWRMLHGRLPETRDRDVFRSLEKFDTSGNAYVEFAVDIDTGSKVDADFVLAKLQAVAGDVFDVYHSGNKGFHVQLPFEKWHLKSPDWPSIFRRLAEHLDILSVTDTSIFSRNSLLRVEDSLNTKSGKNKTLLYKGKSPRPSESWDELVTKLASDIAAEPRRAANASKGGSRGSAFQVLQSYVPPCITQLMLDGIPVPGSRHTTYLHLISYHYRRGDSEDECLENMKAYAEDFSENTNTPEHSRVNEVERLVNQVYRHGLSFECARAQDIGVCDTACRLFNQSIS